MTIVVKKDGEKLTLAPEGRIDTVTSPEFGKSIGLRVLLTTQKNMNKVGTMKLIHVNDVIMDVFNITGFVDILTIE